MTLHEFKYFVFPQLSPSSGAVMVPEAHADLDTDYDGQVSYLYCTVLGTAVFSFPNGCVG